jgi:hypothetical protein
MNRTFPSFLLLLVFLSAATYSAAGDSASAKEPPEKFTKVTAGKFTFSYAVVGKNLSAVVSYPAIGYIAVGFNPKTAMKGANFIIGTIIDGKAVVSDEFGDGMFSHTPDTALGGVNNIIAGDCKQENKVTTMSFTIPLDSKDAADVLLEPGKKIKVVFAVGSSNDTRKKHRDIDKTSITL